MSGKDGRHIYTEEELLQSDPEGNHTAQISHTVQITPVMQQIHTDHSQIHSDSPDRKNVESLSGKAEKEAEKGMPKSSILEEMDNVSEALSHVTIISKERISLVQQAKDQQSTAVINNIIQTLEAYDPDREPTMMEVKMLRQLLLNVYAQQSTLKEETRKRVAQQQKQIIELLETVDELTEQYKAAELLLRRVASVKKPKHEAEGYEASCYYCGAVKHVSVACPQFNDVTSRKGELRKENRCFRCLEVGHWKENCTQKGRFNCQKCKTPHHFSICPKKMTKGAVEERIEREKLFHEQAKEEEERNLESGPINGNQQSTKKAQPPT